MCFCISLSSHGKILSYAKKQSSCDLESEYKAQTFLLRFDFKEQQAKKQVWIDDMKRICAVIQPTSLGGNLQILSYIEQPV